MEQNNQLQSDEIEIDLAELFGVVMSRIGIILFCGINMALAAFLISMYLLVPKYESTTKIYIINRQSTESLTYSDLQSGTQLTKDYKELVTSRPVLEQVISELNLEIDSKKLIKEITVEVPTDTRIVTITVEDRDPYMARSIADAVRTAASEHIARVMSTEEVNVVEEANLPIEQSSPDVLMNTGIGAIVGLFLSMAIIILVHIMDDTIKNPDDVEHYLGVSVLGSIPMTESLGKSKRKKKSEKKKTESSGSAYEKTGRDVFERQRPQSSESLIVERKQQKNG